jgi:UDP-N-acetylmuramoylalanine--D-glutamate ligase
MDILASIKSGQGVGILGGGVTGKAVAQFCEKRGIPHKIYNERGRSDEQFSEAEARNTSLIVRSPSFMISHRWTQLALASGCRCVTELELAACFWRGKIIAVTGTNGKTTTTEFLVHALKMQGEVAVACGNIGDTFIETVDASINDASSWAVVEVSSFQMDGAQLFKPDYVIWLNFAADHLDMHTDMLEYFNCKANLIRSIKTPHRAAECCFVGKSVAEFCQEMQVDDIVGKYTICGEPEVIPAESVLNISTQTENFALVEKFWTNNNFSPKILEKAALTFKLPPHRLQIVAKISGKDLTSGAKKTVEFWNDSKATNFHALDAALASFRKKVLLVAGGKSKNEPIGAFLKIVEERVKAIFLIGETGAILKDAILADAKLKNSLTCKIFHKENPLESVMNNIVEVAFADADDGDIVLLSPGFSSLDWFKDYSERGKFFENSVLCLSSNVK